MNGRILLAALVVIVFLWGGAGSRPQAATVSPEPVAQTTTLTPAELAKAAILANAESSDVYGDAVLKTTDQYQLVYIGKDDYFILNLLSVPLSEARKAAEEALLQKSGNNLEGLCALKVDVGAPLYVRAPSGETVESSNRLDICK